MGFSRNGMAPRWGAVPWAVLLAGGLMFPAALSASPTEVVHARFVRSGDGWNVSVTLRHADKGWSHYANLWVVETLEGQELGRRVLYHPHEDEQPFTRSQTIAIPTGVLKVRVRAGDNVEGLNSKIVVVDLTREKGTRFEVR